MFAELDGEKYISLVTFRKSGEPVHSPVWFAKFGDLANTYGVITETNAGKVKRIRVNPKIEVLPCDIKGNIAVGAPKFFGVARLVTGDEAVAVRKAIGKHYGITYRSFAIYLAVRSLFKKRETLPETNIVFTLTN
ncbi:MAG: PPOX class F420-dependent oxidoreductase [Actinobacteria bacterium]|nr:PPOX class F420-dependent oxidoreductase [Actinomycetota bacterium]